MGTEIEIPDSRSRLITPIIAQMIKSLLSALTAIIIGHWLNWSTGSIVIMVFILIFNSTAVVSEYLKKTGELNTSIGKTTLNILLLQDLLFAPVLTSFQFLQSSSINYFRLISAIAACILVFFFFKGIRHKKEITIPFTKGLEEDHDLQLFVGLTICFGFALLASGVGLTESFGGFVAGIFIARTNTFKWLEKLLKPFKVFFMCLFFLSIGLMLDINYFLENYTVVMIITISVLVINSLLSAFVFHLMKHDWRTSLYAGALLSQIGEYSLLATSLAFQVKIIQLDFYKLVLMVSCLTLLFSTAWITIMRAFIYKEKSTTKYLFRQVFKLIHKHRI
jgi:CPA2 family monovalent cation:H+ antiporter-2